MSIPKAPIANVTSLPERKQNVDSYFWHWLGFHKWTKWSEQEQRFNSYSDAIGNRTWLQDRHCEVCNKYQVRKIREWKL